MSVVVGDPLSCFTRCGWRWDWGVARPATKDVHIAGAVLRAKSRAFVVAGVAPEWVCALVSSAGSSDWSAVRRCPWVAT
eukprot:490613-Amphidinium_carterae.1